MLKTLMQSHKHVKLIGVTAYEISGDIIIIEHNKAKLQSQMQRIMKMIMKCIENFQRVTYVVSS